MNVRIDEKGARADHQNTRWTFGPDFPTPFAERRTKRALNGSDERLWCEEYKW